MISFIGLFVLLAGALALVCLIVSAIATKKLWVIPVFGVLVFFALIALGILPALVLAPHRSVTLQTSSDSNGAQQISEMTNTIVEVAPFVLAPDWSRIVIVLLLIAFGIGVVA